MVVLILGYALHGKFGKHLRSCNEKTKNIFFRFFTLNLITIGPFNKAVGPGKNYKIDKRRAYVYSRV